MTTPLSILDLAPIAPGQTIRESFAASVALAQTAEKNGYERVWYAEHHNMPTIASSATSVLIGHVASQTSTIRLGSGGVMLPNHSPLTIAEQYGTLAELYPDRIDLGLGRAPGSDQTTARAMRRDPRASDQFPQDVMELGAYLRDESIIPGVRAVPGAGTNVPLYILGSSLFGAGLAAALGLPYAFASHFAPDSLFEAIATYRRDFTPSAQLAEPYLMVAANVIAADDAADATEQFTLMRRSRVRSMISRGPATPDYSDEQIDAFLTTTEGRRLADMMRYSAVGTPADVRTFLDDLVASTGADELILAHASQQIGDRLRSVELTAGAMAGALA
ncbi:LLM class flavin-dependent oxidoreductase [Cryobacterium sp. PAMC25264]|uniref:LLM class flavin-dependent oxidoreductase n=1 Tax=Cryobacterium sp. PAMC25264 TaxID=2861288 RepID=UPI001C628AED|nr:LLM class flavin-dependent oxidoreductase [Cryobacterium sp. PAMC25264]QYF74517.1 LLM class flavin-dependent oxidoreductase [Cryobacterium sp. PAMC25264]